MSDPIKDPAQPGRLIIFVLSGLAYCLGFLAPWATLSFLGFSTSFNGGTGLELFAVVAAIAAVGLAVWESFLVDKSTVSLLKTALCAGCFVFAVAEGVFYGFMTHILQFGFGLALMIVASGVCLFLAFTDDTEGATPTLLPIIVLAVLGAGGFAGYKGWEVRKLSDPANWFSGINGLNNPSGLPAAPFGTPLDNTPKIRQDVSIKLNSTREAASLPPSSKWTSAVTPDSGKTFLICNVTVTYNGKTGQLPVSGGHIQLIGSDKHVYRQRAVFSDTNALNTLSAEILPGGTATGEVLFEVNAGTKAEKVEFLAEGSWF